MVMNFMPLGDNPLAFLRTQPQFLHMRQAIQQNPALLPALLQQLGRENPQLLQVTLFPFPTYWEELSVSFMCEV